MWTCYITGQNIFKNCLFSNELDWDFAPSNITNTEFTSTSSVGNDKSVIDNSKLLELVYT